jgi:hypothetical protein
MHPLRYAAFSTVLRKGIPELRTHRRIDGQIVVEAGEKRTCDQVLGTRQGSSAYAPRGGVLVHAMLRRFCSRWPRGQTFRRRDVEFKF